MAQLWFKQIDSGWLPTALSSAVELHADAVAPLTRADAARGTDPILVRHGAPGASQVWLIVAPSGTPVHVNGKALLTGIRALRDRDAIRLDGQSDPVYFSTEHLARIEPFPDEPGIYCARCKLAIEPGQAAVRCPTCSVWFHEMEVEQRCCFSYSDTCALCDQPTDLDEPRFRWTPEEL